MTSHDHAHAHPPVHAHLDHGHAYAHHDNSHGHSHGLFGHSHAPTGSLKALLIVIGLTSTIFFAELIAGFLAGSLALLSDAAHMLSDSAGLLVALIAMLIGRKTSSASATFGYKRVEVFAALINAVVVTVIAGFILVQAVNRYGQDYDIDTGMMLVVAIIGLLVNAISAGVLVRRQHESLNLRGAYLHVLTDLLGSVAVIIAGLVIRYTGFVAADTIASFVIAGMIIPRSLRLAWDAASVLLEQAPSGVKIAEIESVLAGLDRVSAVHDLHIWSLDGNEHLCSCHLVVDRELSSQEHCALLDSAHTALERHGVGHATIQVEPPEHAHHETPVCETVRTQQ